VTCGNQRKAADFFHSRAAFGLLDGNRNLLFGEL